jgi:hypothetical protein
MVTNTQTLPRVRPVARRAKYGLLVKVLLMPFRPVLTLYLMYRLGFIRMTQTQARWMSAALGAVVGSSSIAGLLAALGLI